MALNLEDLVFTVQTKELKDAVLEIGKLGDAVSLLDRKVTASAIKQEKLAQAQEKTAEAAAKALLAEKKLYDAEDKSIAAAEKRAQAEERKAKAIKKAADDSDVANESLVRGVEKVVAKTELMSKFIGEGYRSSFASALTQIELLGGGTEEQMSRIKKAFDSLAPNLKNPFDQSIGPIQSINAHLEKLGNRANLASQGIGLSSKQLEEYSRIYSSVASQFAAAEKDITSGAGQAEFTKMVAEQQKQYISMAKAVNDLELQEKKRNDELTKAAKGTDQAAKATAYLERETLRAEHALAGFNEGVQISTSNRLLKFKEMLTASGIEANKAAEMLTKYETTLKATQAAKNKADNDEAQRRINNLSRGLAPQVSDVAVSLYGGMSPMTVLMQQGLQVRDLIQSSGVEAKDLSNVLKQTGADFIGTLGGTFKAIGALGAGLFTSAGSSIAKFTMDITGANALLEITKRQLASLGDEGFNAIHSLNKAGEFASGVFATSLGIVAVASTAFAVALYQVQQAASAMSESLVLSGAATGLSKQQAIELAEKTDTVGASFVDVITVFGQMAGSSKIPQESFKAISEAALRLSAVSGKSTEDVVKDFAKLADEPVKVLSEYAVKSGNVTQAEIARIEALVKAKKFTQAQTEATEILTRAVNDNALVMEKSMSPISQLWLDLKRGINDAWGAVQDFAKSPTVIDPVRIVLQTVAVIATEVWFAIKGIAQSLGGLGALAVAAFNDITNVDTNFTQTKAVMQGINEVDRARSDSYKNAIDRIMQQGKYTKDLTDKELEGIAAVRRANSDAEKDRLSREKASKENKKTESNSEFEKYVKLVGDLSDKENDLNSNYSENLALIIKYAKTEEDRVVQITQLLMQQPLYTKGIKAQEQAHKDNQKSLDDLFDSINKVEKEKQKIIDADKAAVSWSENLNLSIYAESEALRTRAEMLKYDEVERKKAIELIKIEAKYRKELADIEGKKSISSTTRAELEAEALERKRKAEKNLNSEIALDAAQKLLEEYNRIRDGISDAIVTALFDGGKAGSKKLRDLVVAELRKPITIVVKALVDTAIGSLTGNMFGNSNAMSSLGGSNGGLFAALLGGNNSQLLTSISNVGTTLAGSSNQFFADIGNYMWQNNQAIASMVETAGSVMGYVSALNTAFSRNAQGGKDYGMAIGQALGTYFGGPLGSWIGGKLGKALGIVDYGGTIHTGGGVQYSATGGTQTSNVHGAFGMGFGGTDYSAETTTFVTNVAKSATTILDSVATTFGKKAGYSVATAFADDISPDGAWGGLLIKDAEGNTQVNWNDSRTSRWAPREFANGEAGAKEYLAAVATDIRNVLMEQTPEWADTMLSALGDSTTMEALGTVVETINSLSSVLTDFSEIAPNFIELSDTALSALVKTMGGAEQALAGLTSYYASFYTEEEQKALAQGKIKDEFDKLGIAVPKTRAEFRKIVEGLDLTTEAGRKQYAELIKLAPAFASVTDATQGATEAAKAQADAVKAAAEEALATAKSNTDAALARAKEVINREKKITQEALTSAESQRNALQSIFDLLKQNIFDLYSEVQSTSGMQVQAANQIINDAIRTGTLPSQDILTQAVSVSRSGVANANYATRYEADKARLQLANNLTELQGIAGVQLTAAEQQVKLLKDQIEQFDAMLEHLDQQLDVLRGIDTSNLTIAEALTDLLAIAEEERAAAQAAANANAPATATSGSGGFVIGGSAPGQTNQPAPNASTLSSRGNTYYGSGGTAITDQSYVNRYDSINAYINTLSWAPDDKAASSAALAQAARDYGVGTRDLAIASGYSEADINALLAGQNLPRFAAGGLHTGGLRLVGEEGPELEVTGPARYFSANQTANMLSGDSNSEAIELLTQRLDLMSYELRAIAVSTGKTSRILEDITPDRTSMNTTVMA